MTLMVMRNKLKNSVVSVFCEQLVFTRATENSLLLSHSKSYSLFRPLDVFMSSFFQTLFNITPKFYIWFSKTAA